MKQIRIRAREGEQLYLSHGPDHDCELGLTSMAVCQTFEVQGRSGLWKLTPAGEDKNLGDEIIISREGWIRLQGLTENLIERA